MQLDGLGLSKNMTMTQAFAKYEYEYIKHNFLSNSTIENYQSALKSFVFFTGSDADVEDLEIYNFLDWQAWLQGKNLAKRTIIGYMNRAAQVMQFIAIRGTKLKVLPDDIKIKEVKDRKPIIFLYSEEVTALIEEAYTRRRGLANVNRVRNAALIALLFSSGCRIGEIWRLNRSDVNMVNRSFQAYGKDKDARPAYFDKRSAILLREYLNLRIDDNPALFFANQTVTRLSIGGMQDIVKHIGQKSLVQKRVYPHIFRHSFAMKLIHAKVGLKHIQELMGHESIRTTARYIHVYDYELAETHRKYFK